MNALDFARLQFAITTLFHFIFVPMSIGLALLGGDLPDALATASGDEVWLRATRFWGKFLLISMAIGVVTGIVQEFQFGMNWSLYSRYVGDIFGAPLAMEGLIAFFLESTFLGLWIFGWGRLSPTRAPGDDLARRARARCSRPTSSWPRTPGCSTRSATSINHATGHGAADQHLLRAVQQHRAARVPAHDPRRVHHRRHARARDLRLPDAARQRARRRRLQVVADGAAVHAGSRSSARWRSATARAG